MKLSQKCINLLDGHRIEPFDGSIRRKFRSDSDLQVSKNLEVEAFSRHPHGFLMSLGAFSYVSGATRDTLKMKVGRYCSIARGVNIVSGNHPIEAVTTNPFFYGHYHKRHMPEVVSVHETIPFTRDLGIVHVENDVWIGGYCVLKGGIRIGNGSVIATGSVVVKDVPPYMIVGGNPAKIIRPRFDEKIIEILLATEWWRLDPQALRNLDMFDIPQFCHTLQIMKDNGTVKPFEPAVFTWNGIEIVQKPAPKGSIE